MPNYSTTAKLKARFENDTEVAYLTDTGTTGVPDEDVLTEVLTDAEAEIDSYLATVYLVPVAVADHASLAARMDSLTLDIAQFRLVARGNHITDAKQKLYDAALVWLQKVADGEVVLPTPDTEAATESREPDAQYGRTDSDTATYRAFTRDNVSAL